MATPPRFIVEGQLVDVTLSATGASFRFLPTQPVRESLEYLFWETANRHGMLIHEYEFMGNHLHFLATDVRGELLRFMQTFGSMVSRQLNALRDSTGSNIEKGFTLIHLSDDAKVVDKAAYILANAVNADLVDHVWEWAGPNSLRMNYGRSVSVRRPKCGLWKEKPAPKTKRPRSRFESRRRLAYLGRSKYPKTVSAQLVRPPVLGEKSDQELREQIRGEVRERERMRASERKRTGKRVLGMAAVLKQGFRDTPKSPRKLFKTKPRVGGLDVEKKRAKLAEILAFEREYRRARDAYLAGDYSVEFPHGTWLMRVRFGVSCASPP